MILVGKQGLWMAAMLLGVAGPLAAAESAPPAESPVTARAARPRVVPPGVAPPSVVVNPAPTGFVPPAEGPVAFRRDRIPLDADAIEGLSKHLEKLARGLDAETAAERRGAAQMLALALALDPGNANARNVLAQYVKDRHEPDVDDGQLLKARAAVWRYMSWLGSPEAGDEARALADCLIDVLIVSDPTDPRVESLRGQGEKGAWAGWVSPVSAYEAGKPEMPDLPGTPPDRPAGAQVVKLAKAEVDVPLWRNVGVAPADSWQLLPAPLEMKAKYVGNEEPGSRRIRVRIGGSEESYLFDKMSRSIQALLETTYPDVPAGLEISIGGAALSQSIRSKKRVSISAPAAVLASAAITGREPDAVVLGQIDGNGDYKMPTRFWDQLLSLGEGGGRRLVVPADAASDLSSMLALEKPGFFMGYEVVLATNFKEVIELSAATSEGPVAVARADFKAIRERCGDQDVRQYIGNSFVRGRLAELLQKAPYHYSARMLMTQALGNRPTSVTRQILAAELRRALEPMTWIATDESGVVGFSALNSEKLARIDQSYDSCKALVDGLERYAEKKDLDLVERANAAVLTLRSIKKAARGRGEYYDAIYETGKAQREVASIYQEVVRLLAAEAGDLPRAAED